MSPSSPRGQARAIFLRKWVGFVSALWVMVFCGSYTFANYSTALKEVLGLNQTQLSGLSIARNVGDCCIGIIAGIFSSRVPVWTLLCISASFGLVGYGVEWLVVSQTINPLPYWVMLIVATIGGSVLCWLNVAVFHVSARNFENNRGPVSGLLKACMGLSAAVFFVICDMLFSNAASMYLLMLVTIPTLFSLIAAIFFRPAPSAETQEEQQAEQAILLVFSTMASVVAILIVVITFLSSTIEENMTYKVFALCTPIGILGALAFVPFLMSFKITERESKSHRNSRESNSVAEQVNRHERAGLDGKSSEIAGCEVSPNAHRGHDVHDRPVSIDREKNELNQPLLDDDATVHVSSGKQLQRGLAKLWCCDKLLSSPVWRAQDLGVDKSTLSLFKTWHFYLLYISLFCGCGSGLVFSNNLGQVSQSLGSSSADLFASLFSLGNFFGRVAAGNVSEYFLREKAVPRPAWMGIAKLPMILLFLWLSAGSTASLYMGSILLGFCHGSLVTLSVPIISEFYGLKYFGTNFMLISTYFSTGSYVFSSMAGYLYDRQPVSEDDSGSLTCYGSNCFSTTFQIMASFLSVAVVCDAGLSIISRSLYQKLQLMAKQAMHTH